VAEPTATRDRSERIMAIHGTSGTKVVVCHPLCRTSAEPVACDVPVRVDETFGVRAAWQVT
jgi:hypothetical protein